jgi:hypothetical protein
MWFRVYYVPVLSVDDVVNFILCCTARRSLTRETENDEEGRVMMQKRDVSALARPGQAADSHHTCTRARLRVCACATHEDGCSPTISCSIHYLTWN